MEFINVLIADTGSLRHSLHIYCLISKYNHTSNKTSVNITQQLKEIIIKHHYCVMHCVSILEIPQSAKK